MIPLFLKMLVKLLCVFAFITAIRADAYEKCTHFDCNGKAACVTIYQHKNFGGWYQCQVIYSTTECIDFNKWWIGSGSRVSAANTHGTCVRLFDRKGCSGNYVEIKPGSAGHRNLATVGFGDLAKSVSSCKRNTTATKRNHETYKKCTRNDCTGKSGCVTIYQTRNFGGWYQCLSFRNTECSNLNPYWIRYGPRVSSVNNHDTCIRLFEGENCKGTAVEVKPGSLGQRYLSNIDFDERTRSVSACTRNVTNSNKACYVKRVFGKSTDSSQMYIASSNVLAQIDQVASIGVDILSSLEVPGVSAVYSAIKFIIGLFVSENSMTEALIDAKVEAGLARNTASQMSAKMRAIDNRLSTVLDNKTPALDKRIALASAMHTCEEIKGLFADASFSFSKNKLVSSPYLVAFSAVYLSVAKFSYQMRPETRPNLMTEMGKLAKLNREYKFESLRVRGGYITYGWYGSKRVVEDRIYCKPGPVEGEVSSSTKCYIYAKCARVVQCQNCLENVKTSVDKEIRQFFEPTIKNIEKFPN